MTRDLFCLTAKQIIMDYIQNQAGSSHILAPDIMFGLKFDDGTANDKVLCAPPTEIDGSDSFLIHICC